MLKSIERLAIQVQQTLLSTRRPRIQLTAHYTKAVAERRHHGTDRSSGPGRPTTEVVEAPL